MIQPHQFYRLGYPRVGDHLKMTLTGLELFGGLDEDSQSRTVNKFNFAQVKNHLFRASFYRLLEYLANVLFRERIQHPVQAKYLMGGRNFPGAPQTDGQ